MKTTNKKRRIGNNLMEQLPIARKFGKQGRFGLLNFTMDMVTGHQRLEFPVDSGFNYSSWGSPTESLEINGRAVEV